MPRSQLSNKYFHEPMPKEALLYLIKHELPKLELDPNDERHKDLPTRLKNLISRVGKDGMLAVAYEKKVTDAAGDGLGRDYSSEKLSNQNFHRSLRNAVVNYVMAKTGETYVDVDVENCHPELFLQILQKAEVKCDYDKIKEYVDRRPAIRKDIERAYDCDKGTAKNLVFALINFGCVKGWASRYRVKITNAARGSDVHRFLLEFQGQLKACTKELMSAMPLLVETARLNLDDEKARTDKLALEKKFVHVLLSDPEDKVLRAAMACILKMNNSAKVVSKMFDGCIVKCNGDVDCNRITAHVSKETGFWLKFTLKPFETHIVIPTDLPPFGSSSESDLSEVERLIVKAIKSPSHFNYGFLFHTLWPNSFAYTDAQSRWFRFKAPRWISAASNTSWIVNAIDFELKPIVHQFIERVHDECLQVPCVLDKPMDDTMARVDSDLGCISFKNNVVLQLQSLYQVDNSSEWISSLDANPDLLGLDDCVYDVAGREYRDGRPEDMISMSCGHKRSDVEFFDEGIANSIYDAVTGMFDDEEMFSYVWGRLSSCVSGRRPCDAFDIWTGKGRNGKGVIKALMSAAYGTAESGYYYEPDALVFTTARQSSSGPCPELAKFKGKRCCMSSEANGGETLQLALLKKLTGGDPIQARELHKSFIEIIPTFNLFLLFNVIPSIDDTSNATKRRLRVNDFPFEYFENPDPEDGRQKQMVVDLRETFGTKRYGATALGVMIKWFDTHGHRIPLPDCVANASSNFMLINDPLNEFMLTHYVKGGDKDYVYIKDVMHQLKGDPTYRSQLGIRKNAELIQNLRNKGFVVPYTKMRGYDYVKGLKTSSPEFMDCDE